MKNFLLALLILTALLAACAEEEPEPLNTTELANQSPEDAIESIIKNADTRADGVENTSVTPSYYFARLSMESAWDEETIVRYMHEDVITIICQFREYDYDALDYRFAFTIPTVDDLGNQDRAVGLNIEIANDVGNNINCDNQNAVDVKSIAQIYDLSTILD